jgi:hypothetical protein
MTDLLDIVRSGVHIYEAHARMTMGYDQPVPLKVLADPANKLYHKDWSKMYALAKARVIGLGYGCGPDKFIMLASWHGLNLDKETSTQYVQEFRQSNYQIPQYWADHDKWLWLSANNRDATHEVELLSGRTLEYFRPRKGLKKTKFGERWNVFVRSTPDATPLSIWGGTLTENEIQATAMDVLRTGVSRLDPALANRFLLDIHDEVVFCLPEDRAEEMAKEIDACMTDIPWLPKDFPLEIDGKFVNHYQKT